MLCFVWLGLFGFLLLWGGGILCLVLFGFLFCFKNILGGISVGSIMFPGAVMGVKNYMLAFDLLLPFFFFFFFPSVLLQLNSGRLVHPGQEAKLWLASYPCDVTVSFCKQEGFGSLLHNSVLTLLKQD